MASGDLFLPCFCPELGLTCNRLDSPGSRCQDRVRSAKGGEEAGRTRGAIRPGCRPATSSASPVGPQDKGHLLEVAMARLSYCCLCSVISWPSMSTISLKSH